MYQVDLDSHCQEFFERSLGFVVAFSGCLGIIFCLRLQGGTIWLPIRALQKMPNHTMLFAVGESVWVLGVFLCWRALVRVTSQTTAPMLLLPQRNFSVRPESFPEVSMFLPKYMANFYLIAVIGQSFSDVLKLECEPGKFKARRIRCLLLLTVAL